MKDSATSSAWRSVAGAFVRALRIPMTFAIIGALWVLANRGQGPAWPIGRVLLTYLLAALAAGAIIALLGGWATSRQRGAFLGWVGGVLIGFLLNGLFLAEAYPPGLQGFEFLILGVVPGGFPGAFVGALLWTRPSA